MNRAKRPPRFTIRRGVKARGRTVRREPHPLLQDSRTGLYTVIMDSNRVLICGGEAGGSPHACLKALGQLLSLRKIDVALIHGGHPHAETAQRWAVSNGIDHIVYALNVRRHGDNAWRHLNRLLIEHGNPDGIVALNGGQGIDHLLRLAVREGIPVWKPYGSKVTDL